MELCNTFGSNLIRRTVRRVLAGDVVTRYLLGGGTLLRIDKSVLEVGGQGGSKGGRGKGVRGKGVGGGGGGRGRGGKVRLRHSRVCKSDGMNEDLPVNIET